MKSIEGSLCRFARFGEYSGMVLATGQGVDGVVALTIGMATYNDFNGVYFTLQALRLYQDLRDTELLVVDNLAARQPRNWWKAGCTGRGMYSPQR